MQEKNSSSFLYIFFIAFIILGCSNYKLTKLTEISNGGIEFKIKRFDHTKDFFEKLEPGETLIYWKDKVLGLEYGPNYPKKVLTRLSNELITEVSFIGFETEEEEKGFVTGMEDEKFERKVEKMIVTSSTTIEELLETLENSSTVFSISLSSVINLYSELKLLSEQSIEDFLSFLLKESLIGTEEFERLKKIVVSLGIGLEISLEEFLKFLKSQNIEINVFTSGFIKFLKNYNLSYAISSEEIEQILTAANIDIGVSSDQLNTLFKGLGLLTNVDTNLIVTKSESGKPEMMIEKQVDREKTSYSSKMKYTITFRNVGKLCATDIIIIDSLPIGIEFLKSEIEGNSYSMKVKQMKNNQILFWKLKHDVESNDGGIISFQVKVIGYSKE